ncbi:hypothetical protein LCGC14_2192180, partial [marine sediment metagenome]
NMTPEETPNGHSHMQAWLLGSNQIIPILAGQMCTGTWQRLFLVELDSPRDREVVVMVWGVAPPDAHHKEV